MKIIIAEDDRTSAELLRRILTQAGYTVVVVQDGAQALAALLREPADAVLTDWMMPNMDGIELTRRIRAQVRPVPIIVFVTAINADEARNFALDAGADGYLTKPYLSAQVLACLENCRARKEQPAPTLPSLPPIQARPVAADPRFTGVGIVASTGGPEALLQVIGGLSPTHRAAYFVVLHAPGWMINLFAKRLQTVTQLKVHVGDSGQAVVSGQVYMAPGERHMQVSQGMRLQLTQDEPENFVRPAGDPLFRSLAAAFGRHSMAVILTGMGRDGGLGAANVSGSGGVVLAQDPDTAVARSMPQTVINLGMAKSVVALTEMAPAINRQLRLMDASLHH